jgi:hypothetical protein
MRPEESATVARQFKRRATVRAARLEPHEEHASQYRLSFPDVQSDLAVVDVSEGGLGLSSGFYVPKNMRVIIHLPGTVADDATPAQRDLTIRAVVRRCSMVDHRPTYLIGLQYAEPNGADELELVKSTAATARKQSDAETK